MLVSPPKIPGKEMEDELAEDIISTTSWPKFLALKEGWSLVAPGCMW